MLSLLRVVLIFSLVFSPMASWASDEALTPLQEYIGKYPPVGIEMEDASLEALLTEMVTNRQLYSEHYEGPEDDGTYSEEHEDFWKKRIQRSGEAQQLVVDVLGGSVEEINLFTLEMMKTYLEKPETRPAIKEVLEAFSALKFNESYWNELDAAVSFSASYSDHFTKTIIGAVGVCFIVARFRPQFCSSLVRRGRIAKRIVQKSKARKGRAGTRGRGQSKSSKAASDEMGLLGRAYQKSVQAARKKLDKPGKTLGGLLATKAYIGRYLKVDYLEGLGNFIIVAGATGVVGGTTYTVRNSKRWWDYDKLNPDLNEHGQNPGRFNSVLIDPSLLEQNYYTALAILELTCQAKMIGDKDPEDITTEEIIDFLPRAHEQVLLLGRMGGGLHYFNKSPLEFVTVAEGGNAINVSMGVADDYTEEFQLPCPGVSTQPDGLVYASLSELEVYISILASAALSKNTAEVKEKMQSEQESQLTPSNDITEPQPVAPPAPPKGI